MPPCLPGQSLADGLLGQVDNGRPAGGAGSRLWQPARLRRGDFFLSRLLDKPLAVDEVRALLLVAIYRVETRPDAVHTVVDQAFRQPGSGGRQVFAAWSMAFCATSCAGSQELTAAAAADTWRRPSIRTGGWRSCRRPIRRLAAYRRRRQPAAADGLAGQCPADNARRLILPACSAAGIEARAVGEDWRWPQPVAVDSFRRALPKAWSRCGTRRPARRRTARAGPGQPGARCLRGAGRQDGAPAGAADLELLALDLKDRAAGASKKTLIRLASARRGQGG